MITSMITSSNFRVPIAARSCSANMHLTATRDPGSTTDLEHGQVLQGLLDAEVRHIQQPDQSQLPQAVAHAADAEQTAVCQPLSGAGVQPQRLHMESASLQTALAASPPHQCTRTAGLHETMDATTCATHSDGCRGCMHQVVQCPGAFRNQAGRFTCSKGAAEARVLRNAARRSSSGMPWRQTITRRLTDAASYIHNWCFC